MNTLFLHLYSQYLKHRTQIRLPIFKKLQTSHIWPKAYERSLMNTVRFATRHVVTAAEQRVAEAGPSCPHGPQNTYLPFVCGFYSDFFNPAKVTGWFWTLNGKLLGAAISDLGFHSRISEKAHLLQSSGFWTFHIFLGSPACSLKINLIKMGFPLLGNDQITSPTLSQI